MHHCLPCMCLLAQHPAFFTKLQNPVLLDPCELYTAQVITFYPSPASDVYACQYCCIVGVYCRPAKYFSIDRVFRNEAVDRTHLAEFHQVEGLVCDKGLTLGHLIATLQVGPSGVVLVSMQHMVECGQLAIMSNREVVRRRAADTLLTALSTVLTVLGMLSWLRSAGVLQPFGHEGAQVQTSIQPLH